MIIWRGFLFTWDKYSDALKFGETIVDCLSPARKPYGWQLQEISQVDRKNVLIAEWKKTITKRISGFINMFGIQIRGKRITLNKTNETLLSRIKTVGSAMHPQHMNFGHNGQERVGHFWKTGNEETDITWPNLAVQSLYTTSATCSLQVLGAN